MELWPKTSPIPFALLMAPSTLTPPKDTGIGGGLIGRWVVVGHFNLSQDHALVIPIKKLLLNIKAFN